MIGGNWGLGEDQAHESNDYIDSSKESLYYKLSCSQRIPTICWDVKAYSDRRRKQKSDRREQDHQGHLICRQHRLLLTSLVGIFFQSICMFVFFPVCGCDLAQGGFFIKNGEYLCTLDYQRMYGTRCNGCGEFVEGEVVTALGKTYHPSCFACTVCK